MPSTWIDLTNRLLRKVNDVEIPVADFASSRGVQAAAKDAIQEAVKEIGTFRHDWPFLAQAQVQNLTIGVAEYDWPTDFNAVDWNSFQLMKDEILGVNHRTLDVISREQWYKYYKDLDDDAGPLGRDIPTAVMPSHGNKFAVTPSPNKSYTIRYRYYRTPTTLEIYNDQVFIPDRFDYVILQGGMMQLQQFKENPQGQATAEKKFSQGIATMVNLFYPNPDNVYTGVINQGGGNHRSSYVWDGY